MDKIAVVGMSGVYPGADSPSDLYKNLLNGKCFINKLDNFNSSNIKNENYIPFGTYLRGVKNFDNDFFKMTSYSAKLTDPQQRIFLNCCFRSLQDAGYNPFKVPFKTGVFGSQGLNMYFYKNIIPSKYFNPNDYQYPILLGNNYDSLSTRVSYKLNLNGPSLTVQSGCSSSLVALDYAIKSIEDDECNMALVGGSNVWLPNPSGYLFSNGSTFSSNGKVSPFDEKANGMVIGSGCSVIVIKKLKDALADNNHIYGTINGIGVNNDGNNKIGYTAPSIKGQVEALRSAIDNAGIKPRMVDYIEAHGTGTHIGDPIEFKALSKVYGKEYSNKKIKIGSIKSNIGHLDAASGITGIIKGLLILKNGTIPKQINYNNSNRNISLKKHGFEISKKNIAIENPLKHHYVAVTSLGIGGTNSHVILSNFSKKYIYKQTKSPLLFAFSSKKTIYLDQMLKSTVNYLKGNSNVSLNDLSYTLYSRLGDFKYRICFVANNLNELIKDINDYLRNKNVNTFDDNALNDWLINNNCGKESLSSFIKKGNLISLPTIHFIGKKIWINAKQNNAKQNNSINDSYKSYLDDVVKIWKNNIGGNINYDDNFESLNGESLTAISIVGDINKIFDLNLDPNLLQNYDTPRKISNLLKNKIKNNGSNNIVTLNKGNKHKTLFLIHPAGGSVFCYKKLISGINSNISIYGISFPENVNPDKTINSLASIYAKEIKNICNDSEVIIGGYSFGGNEALAVIKELEKQNIFVKKAILIDSIVPESYLGSSLTHQEYLNRFPDIWKFLSANYNDNHMKTRNFVDIDDAINFSKKHNIIDKEFSNSMIKRMFKVWTSNHKVLSNQLLPKNNDLTIYLFFASKKLSRDIYSFTKMKPYNPLDWKKYCGYLNFEKVEGNHYSIFGDKNDFSLFQTQFAKLLKKI